MILLVLKLFLLWYNVQKLLSSNEVLYKMKCVWEVFNIGMDCEVTVSHTKFSVINQAWLFQNLIIIGRQAVLGRPLHLLHLRYNLKKKMLSSNNVIPLRKCFLFKLILLKVSILEMLSASLPKHKYSGI